MTLTRRGLLTTGAVLFLAVGAGAARLTQQTKLSYVKSVVRTRLHYLSFSDETLDEFACDFVQLIPAISAARGAALAAQGRSLSQITGRLAGDVIANKIDDFEEKIASEFLKATDFFDHGRDVNHPISYVAFADPYEAACYNPVARLA